MLVSFRREHDHVRQLDDGGDYNNAVLRSIHEEATSAQVLDRGLSDEIAQARHRLDTASADARSGFGVLAVAIPLLIVLAGVFVLVGLQRRITEYR
jgi:hypothetical protein